MATATVQENLRLKPEVLEAFKQAAKLSGLSRAKLLEKLVRDFLEDQEDVRDAEEILSNPNTTWHSWDEIKADLDTR